MRRRWAPAAGAAAVALGAGLWAGPAAAHETITTLPDRLTGVSADSTSDAWATVGGTAAGGCSMLHWDGTSWAPMTCPSPNAGGTELDGVSALSPSDAWAVGNYPINPSSPLARDTFAMHWDGTRWTQFATPNPGGTNYQGTTLFSVSALSPSDAWAVGLYCTKKSLFRTLTLHWDGTSWRQVTSPEPGQQSLLSSVSADSPTDAWAAGFYTSSTGIRKTLVLHWDGTSWTKVISPNPGSERALNGVSAVSSSDIFAVGNYSASTAPSLNLALEGNGTTWTKLRTPNPSSSSFLTGVSALSATGAWAVGQYDTGTGSNTVANTLLLGWNGTKWKQVVTPNPGGSNGSRLTGAGADSALDAWAVGYYLDSSGVAQSLILHWDGKSWTQS